MRDPDQLLLMSKSIGEFAPQTIHISYKLLIDYFEGPLSEAKVITGAYMIYGWMPTMLRLKGPLKPVYDIALLAREGTVNVESLSQCAKTLNNSLVGTTKLIHFVSPGLYPIWDSRVYRALTGSNPHSYRVEQPNLYLEFLEWVNAFQCLSGFDHLKERFEREAGYCVSGARATEAVLYALGRPPKKQAKH